MGTSVDDGSPGENRPVSRRHLLAGVVASLSLPLAACVDRPRPGPLGSGVDDDRPAVDPGGCNTPSGDASPSSDTPRSGEEHVHGYGDEVGDDHIAAHLGSPVPAATVAMSTDDGDNFVPEVVHVVPGGSVTWVLESGAHDTIAYHPYNGCQLRMPESATPWWSPVLTTVGQPYTVSFSIPGLYDYRCSAHVGVGMVGRVVVGDPVLAAEPAFEADETGLPPAAAARFRLFDDVVAAALDG